MLINEYKTGKLGGQQNRDTSPHIKCSLSNKVEIKITDPNLRIPEPAGVNFDESCAVDQDLWAHVAKGDELLTVFETLR